MSANKKGVMDMFIIPIYDMIILPGVTYYFKSDVFRELKIPEFTAGDSVLFMMLKEDKNIGEMYPDDFFKIGVSGTVEGIDGEGNVSIRTKNRENLERISVREDQHLQALTTERAQVDDVGAEEQKERFEKMRASILRFIQGFQWGIWARSYILHWKSMEEAVSAISSYLNLTNEERYAILAADSMSGRMELMEHAVYEFIEMARVGEEAESAQQERHEEVYREEAIKKQIEFLQKQLDEMHPENVSDVRKFEQKIQSSAQ